MKSMFAVIGRSGLLHPTNDAGYFMTQVECLKKRLKFKENETLKQHELTSSVNFLLGKL